MMLQLSGITWNNHMIPCNEMSAPSPGLLLWTLQLSLMKNRSTPYAPSSASKPWWHLVIGAEVTPLLKSAILVSCHCSRKFCLLFTWKGPLNTHLTECNLFETDGNICLLKIPKCPGSLKDWSSLKTLKASERCFHFVSSEDQVCSS